MKAKIRNFKELFDYLNACIQSSLEANVLSEVKDIMYKNIYTYVYNVYVPKQYSRLKDEGGLSDKGNMVFDRDALKNNNRLVVRDVREAVNEDTGDFVNVTDIVQTGKGYTRNFPYKGIARDFTTPTKQEIARTKVHVNALKKGLREFGIKVR